MSGPGSAADSPLLPLPGTAGAGTVAFADGTIRAFPEWWGAKGDGVSDDAAAVQSAYNAAAARGNAMLYLSSSVRAWVGEEGSVDWRALGGPLPACPQLPPLPPPNPQPAVQTYGIGSELVFRPGATIMSEPGARLLVRGVAWCV